MKNREQQIVVITGASAGVGRAIAREFASQGAKIGLLARGIERLEATQKEIEELGGEALVLPTDVSDPKQVELAAETVESTFGPIDIWINNAMVSVFSPIAETTPEEFNRVTDVTYLGYVYGTLAALKRMRPRDRGMIVQVGSALAYRSIPLQSAYCAAKHAVLGFTESLRTELLHDKSGIKITMVHLPAMNTPQFVWSKSRMQRKAQPVPPIFQPEIAARAIVWATQHPKREIYLGFPTIKAIWADKIIPSLADWYLSKKGYDSQQTSELESPDRPNNLWEPVAGTFDARGPFSKRAKKSCFQFELRKRVAPLSLAAAFVFLILVLVF